MSPLRNRADRLLSFLRSPRHLAETALAAALAGAAVALGRRQGHDRVLTFPAPGPLAAETAVAVHNAAKASVIVGVRESHAPSVGDLTRAVEQAVRDAGDAGVDVVAVALGAVEGATEIAHLLDTSRTEAAAVASHSATRAATSVGPGAAERVHKALSAYSRGPDPAAGILRE